MAKKSAVKKNGKRVKRRSVRKKRDGVPFWRQPVVWGLLLASAAFVTMVMFGRLPAPEPPVVEAVRSEAQVLADLRVEVESLLWRLGFGAEDVQKQPSEGMIDMHLTGVFPEPGQVEGFAGRLSEISPGLHVESYPPRKELRVFSGPALAVRIRFSEPVVDSRSPVPTVTIIMDDVGRSMKKVRKVLALDEPVTLAILPSTPYATRAATLAYEQGREVIVHIPMEPQGYPAIEPGRDALLLEHSDWEIKRRLDDMFRKVPHAVGGNNHMGSRYTEYGNGMLVVGEFMRDRGLFFVDSRTTGATLAERVMRDQGVSAVSRDVFLDNDQDVEKIRAQIARLVSHAKRHGRAVGICHPYPETIAALEAELPSMKQRGVRVVSVGDLLSAAQSRGN